MKNFIRKKEDFECLNCGAKVSGDGYTDHCPVCLWGRHVDEVIPGDRASSCRGMMEPIRAIYEKGRVRIYYRCTECGHEFRVKVAGEDNKDKIMELMGQS